jgi:hypothetical protein
MGASSSKESFPKEGVQLIASDSNPIVTDVVPASITYRNFRSPHKSSKFLRVGRSGSLAVTDQRLVAYIGSSRQVNVQFDDARLAEMTFSVQENGEFLSIQHNAALFQPAWKGSVEIRFKTKQANEIHNRIQQAAMIIARPQS